MAFISHIEALDIAKDIFSAEEYGEFAKLMTEESVGMVSERSR
jgi:hypothetical protein